MDSTKLLLLLLVSLTGQLYQLLKVRPGEQFFQGRPMYLNFFTVQRYA